MSNDPYATPTANLDNSADSAQVPTSTWNAKGRLSVLSFLAQSLMVGLVSTIFLAVIFFIGAAMTGASMENLENLDWKSPVVIVLGIIAALVYIAVLYITVCMMIKRLHDRNHSGWWVLGLLVAFIISSVIATFAAVAGILTIIAIIGMLYVTLFPGQKTGNRFGARRETKGWEKVLAILYIVLIIGSIVAGIVGGMAMMG